MESRKKKSSKPGNRSQRGNRRHTLRMNDEDRDRLEKIKSNQRLPDDSSTVRYALRWTAEGLGLESRAAQAAS